MRVVERFIIIGDSLSDRGTMAKSLLAAFSGLEGTSPKGRFSNGYVWDDFFCEHIYQECTTYKQVNSKKISANRPLFLVNDDEQIGTFASPVFVRTYCEGGMTSHDYSSRISGNVIIDATEKVLATLNSMRQKLIEDDLFIGTDTNHKKNTLIIEWSGANDLITVNTHPTLDAAELAVKARIHNLEKLIEQGYQKFILFNLPDLSLTPRFQRKSENCQEKIHQCVRHFNTRLKEEIEQCSLQFPETHITIFDANRLFYEAYTNPSAFGLDEDKKHQPFLESEAFKDHDETTTAAGFMFWDEVHPTEIVQEHLSNHLFPHFQQHYQFQEPKESFLQKFREGYGMKWESDCEKWDGRLRRSNIDYLNADLDTILYHGLFEKGYRTRHIMQQLGWVHANKECATNHPLLTEVYAQVGSDAKKTRSVQKTLRGIFSKNGSANHQAISNGDVKLEHDEKSSKISQNLEETNALTSSEQILTEIELVDMPASSQI